jgi:hypothetical protein
MATATAEPTTRDVDDDLAAYTSLPKNEQQAYIADLHTRMAKEKAATAEPSSEVRADPGKTRAETAAANGVAKDPATGRFVKQDPDKPPQTEPEGADIAANLQRQRNNKDEPSGKGVETPAPADAGAVKPAADAAAPETPEGEEVEDDWRTPEVSDLATQYGLDEIALASIPTREVLDSVLRAIDRKAFEAGKAQTTTAAAPKEPAPQPAAPVPQANGQQQATDDALTLLKSLKLGDGEGNLTLEDREPIEKAFKAMASEIEESRTFRKEMSDLRSMLQQQQVTLAHNQLKADFTTSLDSLSADKDIGPAITELFGKPGERTAEQTANLNKAFEDGHIPHAKGLIAQGRQVGPTPTFAKAAVNLLFGDQLLKQAKAAQLAKLRKSAARRTGGGTTKPNALASNATPLERNLAAAQENWKQARGED